MEEKTIIGVDLGGISVSSGLIMNHRVEKFFNMGVSADKSEQDVLNEVIQSIEAVYDRSAAGIGVGVTSLVNTEKGIVYEVQNIPAWREI